MTICIATDTYYPAIGGVSTFYKNLVNLLLSQGHSVIVITAQYTETLEEDETVVAGEFILIRLKNSFKGEYEKLKPYFRPGGMEAYGWMAMGKAMHTWLLSNHKKYCIDIIEVSDFGGLAFFICDAALPPVVITGHGTLTQLSKYNFAKADTHSKLIHHFERESLKMAQGVIAHSLLNQEDLQQLSGRKVEIATIPWCIASINHKIEEENIIIISGLSAVKGAVVMAEAVRILSSRNASFTLKWIGADSYTAPGGQLVSVYLKKNYPDIWNKHFIWIEELKNEEAIKELAKAKIVVIPSVWETFNQVALEAAFLSKPIIMTKTTGAAYLFKHKQSAYIISNNDPHAIALAILELSANPALQKQIGSEAHKLVKTMFEEGQPVQERISVYEKIRRQKRSPIQPVEQRMAYVNRYLTWFRKYYFKTRSLIKSLIKQRV